MGYRQDIRMCWIRGAGDRSGENVAQEREEG